MGLLRELAPLSERAWQRIDEDARAILRTHLAARQLIDFVGPLGWAHSSIDLGSIEPLEGVVPRGVLVRRRRVRPLIEMRVPFLLSRSEIELVDRGARRIDFDPLHDAARLFALAEDRMLFEGSPDADIPGIVSDSDNEPVPLPRESGFIPDAVADALERLRDAGVEGPYGLALGPEPYGALTGGRGEGGYPILRHVEKLIDGPVLWAPALSGGVLVSRRGGDFRLVCGRDVSIGYVGHDEKSVALYLEESFSAEINAPEAAVAMLPPGAPERGGAS
jgi:uncharacterized linocin/CFP29 family protein